MKLKSGCSFWPTIYQGPEVQTRPLMRDIRCEVAVIGAGISGALATYHLVNAGLHVVVLDRRDIGKGSTAASTGLLQYEIDTPLVDLIAKIGSEKAITAYRVSAEATAAFAPLVAQLADPCGLHARPSLYLAAGEADVKVLQAECHARLAMGIDVKFLSATELHSAFGFSRPAALLSKLGFEVDPYRLTQHLLLAAASRGAEMFTQTEVTRYEADERGVTLTAANGPTVRADHVVFATGYETMGIVPDGLCTLSSTYALCGEPLADLPGWRDRCLIWEAARPYLYVRSAPANRIMVGGQDEPIVDPEKRDALIEPKTEKLRQRFAELFAGTQIETTCAWAGTFSQTKDGLPYIGRLASFPRGYFALGYGGNGITFSLIAAELIRDSILEKPNPIAELFGFDRR